MEPYKYQRHRSQEAPSKCYQAPYSDCSSLPKYTITPNKEGPFSSRVKANSNLTRQNPTAVQDDSMSADNSDYQDNMESDYTSYPDSDMTSDHTSYPTNGMTPDYTSYPTNGMTPDYTSYPTNEAAPGYTSYPTNGMTPDYTSYPDYTFPERGTSQTNQWNENSQMNRSTGNQMRMNNRMQGQMPMNEQMLMNNRMQGQMPPTSPLRMPTFSDEDMDYESDLTYIKQMYASTVKDLLARIQQEFDAVDYDESFIYDTFPDTITLLSMAEFILEQAKREGMSDTVESKQFLPGQRPGFGQQDPWLRYLVETLIYNELLDRRRRRRNRNRRWY